MRRDPRGAQEIRLEGTALVTASLVLVLLIVVAFAAGRLFERDVADSRGPSSVSAPETTAPRAVHDSSDAGRDAGGEDVEEAETSPRAQMPARSPDSKSPPKSVYYVQAFAGRDRDAAQAVVDHLREDGLNARIYQSDFRGDRWFRARLEATDMRAARELVARLVAIGYADAWIDPGDAGAGRSPTWVDGREQSRGSLAR